MMPDSAPSFLRLAFHDAATKRGDGQGPNGSIRTSHGSSTVWDSDVTRRGEITVGRGHAPSESVEQLCATGLLQLQPLFEFEGGSFLPSGPGILFAGLEVDPQGFWGAVISG